MSAAPHGAVLMLLTLIASVAAGCKSDAPASGAAPSGTGSAGAPCGASTDCLSRLTCIRGACLPDEGIPSKQLGPVDKAAECNTLLLVVGRGTADLKRMQNAAPTPETFRAMADVMDKTANDTGQLRLRIAELADLATRYRDMGKEVAMATRSMATASDTRDLEAMNEAAEAMDRAAKKEDPIVDAINAFCGAP